MKGCLRDLTNAVSSFLDAFDAEMKLPATPDRGKRIAHLSNELEIANDRARYFGLKIDYRTDKKPKVRQRKGRSGFGVTRVDP